MTDPGDAPLCLPPRPLSNRAGLRLPVGTCDSHFHVFAPDAPLAKPRSYTPQIAGLDGWLALSESFGIATGVLVQPSVYGLDNSVLLDALAASPGRLRGIVVISSETSDAELRRMDGLGVRGIRINLRNKSGVGFDALPDLVRRIRRLGWHVQFQVGPEAIEQVAELTERHEIAGVIDHLAFMPLASPAPALQALDRALDSGRVYTKISAPYRLRDSADHSGYRQAVAALSANHAERLIWASDWPHTELFNTVPEDDDLVALSLSAVLEKHQAAIFAGNAQALYFAH